MQQSLAIVLTLFIVKSTDEMILSPSKLIRIVQRIRDGNEVSPHAYPFQVALIIYRANAITGLGATSLCGGTLISKSLILTAAHCLTGAAQVQVVLAAHDLAQEEGHQIRLLAESYVVHEGFNMGFLLNDIALVRLPTEVVEFNRFVDVVSLPRTKKNHSAEHGVVIGWGTTGDLLSSRSVLKSAEVIVVEVERCAKIQPYGLYVTQRHMCVISKHLSRPCTGDSGGPLLVDNVQVGIVSFGDINCSLGTPTIFTRVDYFLDWIKDHRSNGNLCGVVLLFVKMLLMIHLVL